MGLRSTIALWIGKIIIYVLRLLGRAGSSLPGKVAIFVDPGILRKLARRSPMGNLVVTGTNGKTTTTGMISAVLSVSGKKIACNHTGANLLSGISSALISRAGPQGTVTWEIGLLEVDEATMPKACEEVRPKAILVTNVFKDQVDRFGDLANVVELLRQGTRFLSPDGVLVLNADDPLVSSIGIDTEKRVFYYGIQDTGLITDEKPKTGYAGNCPLCSHPLTYSNVFYAHLGHYQCVNCGFKRPTPDVFIDNMEVFEDDRVGMCLRSFKGQFNTIIPLPGLYNAYNALAAASVGLALGEDVSAISRGIQSYGGSFGRMEKMDIGAKRALMILVKNPAGFNEVLKTVIQSAAPKTLLICLNDSVADGTDISWIHDVEFELLAKCQKQVGHIWVSGSRAHDMGLRLMHAGIDPDKIVAEPDLQAALNLILLSSDVPESMLYILPTYTAMLQLRQILNKLGYVNRFWNN